MIIFSGFLREGFEEKTAEHWKNLGKSAAFGQPLDKIKQRFDKDRIE